MADLCGELSPESGWPCVLNANDPHLAGHESAYHGTTRAVWATTRPGALLDLDQVEEWAQAKFKADVPYWTSAGIVSMNQILAPVIDENRRLRELLSYLELHIGRYEWKQLTTEQKELLADIVDEARARRDVESSYTGTDMAAQPVERWWRG